jgi:hypothetical protein
VKHRVLTCFFLAIFVTFSSSIVHVHSECRGLNSFSRCMMDPAASSITPRELMLMLVLISCIVYQCV